MKLINPNDIQDQNFLSWDEPLIFYPEQLIPIYTPYCEKKELYTVKQNRILAEFANSYKCELKKGDKLCFDIATPRNGNPDSANSYKLLIDRQGEKYYQSFPLLNLIPQSCEGGTLKTFKKHYDAVLQIKNLQEVVEGNHETKVQYEQRALQVISEVVPDKNFWVAKPYNSRSGFETPQKVILQNGKYLRLRCSEWQTKEMLGESYLNSSEDDIYHFNVWGEYKTKEDVAWHVLHNACLILKTPEQVDEPNLWSKQFDYYESETIKRYDRRS